jgi:hypothetical protein
MFPDGYIIIRELGSDGACILMIASQVDIWREGKGRSCTPASRYDPAVQPGLVGDRIKAV